MEQAPHKDGDKLTKEEKLQKKQEAVVWQRPGVVPAGVGAFVHRCLAFFGIHARISYPNSSQLRSPAG